MVYEREIGKGKKKQAYIVVARHLLYHVYSMMKNEKPYRVRLPNTKGGRGELLHEPAGEQLDATPLGFPP
jgi:hypothetical protein